MTVHKCLKCKKVYDCKNKMVQHVNKEFFAQLYGFKSQEELKTMGGELKEPKCAESYESTCPYCAFKVILGREYESI